MSGHETTLLLDLLLVSLLIVAAVDALCEKLAEPWVLEDLDKHFM